MNVYEYLEKHQNIYNARLTRKKFIPIEKIAKNPKKYGYEFLLKDLPENYTSNAKQTKFIYSIAKITAAICANRGGKSEALAIKCIHDLENIKVDKGGRYWVLTESFDLQKSGIQTKINEYFKPERIIKDSISYVKKGVYSSFIYQNRYGIKIPIEFKTYEQGSAKLQAAKLYGALFDEEPPEDIYDEVYMRTIDLKGKINMAFTPLKGLTWSYDIIYKSLDDQVLCLNWGIIDNPFIPRNEIDRLRKTLSPRKAKMRLEGIYQGAEMMIYESFSRHENMRDKLFDERFPVSVCIDWGIRVVAVGFFQEKTITIRSNLKKDEKYKEYYLVDAFEMTDVGYGAVMKRILDKKYYIPSNEWFCDPAGSARSQATRTGISLLQKIKTDFGINFNYIKKLGIEESIELVQSCFLNSKGERTLFIQKGIYLNNNEDTPEKRIEGYVRDEKTLQPIKDGVVDHFCDMLRYLIANKLHLIMGSQFKQH